MNSHAKFSGAMRCGFPAVYEKISNGADTRHPVGALVCVLIGFKFVGSSAKFAMEMENRKISKC